MIILTKICLFLAVVSNGLNPVMSCCDPLNPIANFNASKFSGDWNVYAIDRKQNVLNCLVKKFTVVSNMQVAVSEQFRYSGNNSIGISSSRIILGNNNLGFWTDTASQSRVEIIATDYTSYAVCASCVDRFGSNVWVLTRSIHVDSLLKYRIATVLNGISFSPNYLVETPFDRYTCSGYANRSSFLLTIIFGIFAKFFVE